LAAAAAALLVLAAAAPAPVCAEPLVLCLGDSLTEGYAVDPDNSYPAQLQRVLRTRGWPQIEIVNAGISGSTSAGGVSRLAWQMRRKPDVLVLALGANDGLRGTDLDTTKANLAAVIAEAKTNGVAVLLAGMKMPPNYGPDYTHKFESMYGELAREHEVALVPFLLDGVAARPDLNLADGIHPNADGYRIVADTVAEALVPLLRRLAGAHNESAS
jgi:acyl-CoA thioesterase-1